jgi:hypothetical protein
MDLVGPLPTAQGNYKYAVVAIEYFTKWVEAKPLIKITSEAVWIFFGRTSYADSGYRRSSRLTTANSSTHNHSENSAEA